MSAQDQPRPASSSRPPIPAEMRREIMVESRHRCAVCGSEGQLEIAHIIPWSKCKEHRLDNLLCMCPNCHRRADKERWGPKTFRLYKEKPYAAPSEDGVLKSPPHTVTMRIADIDLDMFDERVRRIARGAIAETLGIPVDSVVIQEVEEGSVLLSIGLPADAASRLHAMLEAGDPQVDRILRAISDAAGEPSFPVEEVRGELRSLARDAMALEVGPVYMEPAEIIQEAFARLAQHFSDQANRTRFVPFASAAMRRILVDQVRESGVEIRFHRLDPVADEDARGRLQRVEVTRLDEAIEVLSEIDSTSARVVELRVFGGLTTARVAQVLGISKSAASVMWRNARVHLVQYLASEVE